MQINVAQLLKEGTGATRSHDIDAVLRLEGTSAPAGGAAPVSAPALAGGQECRVQGRVTLTRAARGILLAGSFSCPVRLTCGRCLASFPHLVGFDVQEMFYPSIDIATGLPLALPEEDDSSSFTIDEHHLLDTSEMIRQYCLLAIPMKPLCRADCGGLCPDCGANLNEKHCGCAPVPRTALARALEQAIAVKQSPAPETAAAPDRAPRTRAAPEQAGAPERKTAPARARVPGRTKSRRKLG